LRRVKVEHYARTTVIKTDINFKILRQELLQLSAA
jgi:hypothetical protein